MGTPDDRTAKAPSPPLHCPKCLSTNIRGVSCTDQFVYLQCWDCAEVWPIPERRARPREPQFHIRD
jgi:hypothetical protein